MLRKIYNINKIYSACQAFWNNFIIDHFDIIAPLTIGALLIVVPLVIYAIK